MNDLNTVAATGFKLPELPFEIDALAPMMSAETLEYHHGKHHRAYVTNLNRLVEGTEYEGLELEFLIRQTDGALFNNAAQAWNHEFFWQCLVPGRCNEPGGVLSALINRDFGSLEALERHFKADATAHFGSGWVWLVQDEGGRLRVQTTSDAGNPIREGCTPLLVCDVWEHAYYIDYRNRRPAYLDAFWQLVNWHTAESRVRADVVHSASTA